MKIASWSVNSLDDAQRRILAADLANHFHYVVLGDFNITPEFRDA